MVEALEGHSLQRNLFSIQLVRPDKRRVTGAMKCDRERSINNASRPNWASGVVCGVGSLHLQRERQD